MYSLGLDFSLPSVVHAEALDQSLGFFWYSVGTVFLESFPLFIVIRLEPGDVVQLSNYLFDFVFQVLMS